MGIQEVNRKPEKKAESTENAPKCGWFSPVESFKNLRTRSQRTLKKHHNTTFFESLDLLLYSLKCGLFSHNINSENYGNQTGKTFFSLEEFVPKSKINHEIAKMSFLFHQVSILLSDIDFSDTEFEEESLMVHTSNHKNMQLLLCFDFDDSFQRHILHAIAEFYDLVSFSRMCYHEHSSECYCQRSESPTHRITIVHCRRQPELRSDSSSSSLSSSLSSLPSSLTTSSYLSSFPDSQAERGAPTSLFQFLKSYIAHEKS